jgi:hypothetical protein
VLLAGIRSGLERFEAFIQSVPSDEISDAATILPLVAEGKPDRLRADWQDVRF